MKKRAQGTRRRAEGRGHRAKGKGERTKKATDARMKDEYTNMLKSDPLQGFIGQNLGASLKLVWWF